MGFRVRAKLTSGKLISGPSAAETMSDAVAEAEEAAEAAGAGIKMLSIKPTEVETKLTIHEPRKRAEKKSAKGKGK